MKQIIKLIVKLETSVKKSQLKASNNKFTTMCSTLNSFIHKTFLKIC